MKLTAISMVRNEADVVEAFVRHHAEIVDELVIVDHRSADGTAELLSELAAEGLPLEPREEPSPVHRQNVVLTGLMREAAAAGADWVLPLDADEFLIAPSGSSRDVLADLPDERPCAIDARLYVPTPDDPKDEPHVLRRVQHRRELENGTWTRKVIVPARWARNPRFTLAQGNHGLIDSHKRVPLPGSFARASLTDRVALGHFPVRSARQIARKVLGGWPAWMARPDRARGGNFQWQRAFDQVVSGRRLGARQLQDLACDYTSTDPDGRRPELVVDPVPCDFELRYAPRREPTPREVLAETAVMLAEELSHTLREGAA